MSNYLIHYFPFYDVLEYDSKFLDDVVVITHIVVLYDMNIHFYPNIHKFPYNLLRDMF